MRSPIRRLAHALAALAAALVLVAIPDPAVAGNNGSFAVQPTSAADSAIPRQYFVYTLPAGQTVQDSVTITNLTEQTKTFLVYGADGFTTPADGALGLRSRTDPQHGVGAWISMSRGEVSVAPKASVDVPFTMQIPAGVASGDHVGGVVVLDTAITPGSGGAKIGIQQAIAARVYARVDGPVHAGLTITGIWLYHARTPAVVTYTLKNTGNVRLGPDVTTTVTGALSGSIQSTAKQLPADLLPGEQASYKVALRPLPVVDSLTVRIVASTDQVNATGSASVLLLPWWVVVIAVAVLLWMAGTAFWLIRRRRRRRAGPEPDENAELEPVVSA
jgi:hypothetical protein